ncbi:hypothetical protein [Fimbriimonas ginsengisoli]|nr:hypothetical protein [Fimbriimonas ginsengisoli]
MRCVAYRLPKGNRLKETGILLTLGLRYGLVGAASVHHLLRCSRREEERQVMDSAATWPGIVAEHVRSEAAPILGLPVSMEVGEQVGKWARYVLRVAVPLYHRLCPLEMSLSTAADDFVLDHSKEIRQGWNPFLVRRGDRLFRAEADRSINFAINFFERRQHDLEEVPEIALLGE